jgi:hypothetical protein
MFTVEEVPDSKSPEFHVREEIGHVRLVAVTAIPEIWDGLAVPAPLSHKTSS